MEVAKMAVGPMHRGTTCLYPHTCPKHQEKEVKTLTCHFGNCLLPNYMWSKSCELQVMSLKRKRENFFSPLATLKGTQDLSFPDQGLNPCPLQWKRGVLTTGPLGNSQHVSYHQNSNHRNSSREMDQESIPTFESDSREMPQSIPAVWAEMPESAPSEATSTPKSPQSI